MKVKTLLVAAGLSFAATLASAATMQQYFTVGGWGVEFEDGDSFDKYDGPGTLTGVNISYIAGAAGKIKADACATFQDCDPAVYTLTIEGDGAVGSGSDSASDYLNITNLTNEWQKDYYWSVVYGTVDFYNVADWTGAGVATNIDISGDYDGYFNDSYSHGVYKGLVKLTYTYEMGEVPLPASLPLALGGMLLLGGLVRKKRK